MTDFSFEFRAMRGDVAKALIYGEEEHLMWVLNALAEYLPVGPLVENWYGSQKPHQLADWLELLAVGVREKADGAVAPTEKEPETPFRFYLVAIGEMDAKTGQPKGTLHMSSYETRSADTAIELAKRETSQDWDDFPERDLHCFFVMSAPEGVDVSVDFIAEGF